MKTLCMSLKCRNGVIRHPSNFNTGFCDKCQKIYNKNVLEKFTGKGC